MLRRIFRLAERGKDFYCPKTIWFNLTHTPEKVLIKPVKVIIGHKELGTEIARKIMKFPAENCGVFRPK